MTNRILPETLPALYRKHGAEATSGYVQPLDPSFSSGLTVEPVEAPVPRPTIVCLCGSTRFSEAFRAANLRETLLGKIVLTIGCDMKSDDALGLSDDTKTFLDNLHFHKISLADEILVLNVDGYIGESTRNEIAYAREQGKRIRWLETPDHPGEAAFRGGELLSRIQENVPAETEPSIPVSRIVSVLAKQWLWHDELKRQAKHESQAEFCERQVLHMRELFGVAAKLDLHSAFDAELARQRQETE